MPPEIHNFFDSYRDAFNLLSGARVAAHYAEPSAIAQGGVFTLWSTRREVEANMNDLCEQYTARGFVGTSYRPRPFIVQGDGYVVADLLWRIEWRDEAPWEFGTTYNLVRSPQGWRVLLCTAYQEDQLQAARAAVTPERP